MPQISILVPIYKVEPYLRRCLDSVINQSFKNWEMILVDDGSPDGCPDICDEYASADKRISVVHKPNGGLISARLAGFERANSEWIMFLDSDDWLAADALDILYRHASDDVDLIRGGFINDDGAGVAIFKDAYQFEEGIIDSNKDFVRKMFVGEVAPYLWGALYRRSLFSSKHFQVGMAAGISFGEDWITNLLASVNVRKALYIPNIVYHYFRNIDSIVHSCVRSQSYEKKIYDILVRNGIIDCYDLRTELQKKQADSIIQNLFNPEIHIDYSEYQRSRELIDKSSLTTIRRVLYNYEYSYWIYTKLYRIAFKYVRLKGTSRKVLS